MQPHSSDSGPAAKRVRIDLTPSTSSTSEQEEKCFVCDTTIAGKKYSLASCMTNGTKVRLVEVLGRLVSDSYMVVVSHGEHICRGCANLLNTLDRLEAEISSVKRIVLNFVERKYNLGNKLQNQLSPAPVVYSKTVPTASAQRTTTLATGQFNLNTTPFKPLISSIPPKSVLTKSTPPAILTKTTPPARTYLTPNKPILSGAKQASPVKNTTTTLTSTNPAIRTKAYKITLKDDQLMGKSPLQNAELQAIAGKGQTPAGTTPKNVWMQCNQCQYTTNQRPVMLEHLRQHVAARTNTPQNKTTTEVKTSQANGTPTPGTSKQTNSPNISVPKMILTLDGKLSQNKIASTSVTTSATATTAVVTVSSPSAAGIVSKVLSTSTTRAVTTTSSSDLFTPDPVKVVTTTKPKPAEPATPTGPKIFSSSGSKSTPDPSLPILLGDDDM